jgi:glycerol-1-phosphatase
VTALIDDYDAALFDLDGVVYLGPVAVPGAAAGIAELRERSVRVGFVTNNANRPPGVVAEHLQALRVPAEPSDVVTSAQAAAHLLRARFGPGAKVYAVGGAGVWSALEEAGLIGVRSAEDHPLAVIQGWGEDLTWNDLNEAAIAIQRGAHWVATNTDPTRPTDRGLVPGNGAAVAAVQAAVTVRPEVAGKPYRPLLEETVQRLGARRPIFVGDRLDTDIAGALNCGLDSLLVLTGSHTVADLLAAEPGQRPTQLGFDLRALLAPVRSVRVEGQRAVCGEQAVRVEAGSVRFDGPPPVDRGGALDAAWAAAQLVWAAADEGTGTDVERVLAKLGPLLRPDPVG